MDVWTERKTDSGDDETFWGGSGGEEIRFLLLLGHVCSRKRWRADGLRLITSLTCWGSRWN